ncbi:MAG: carbohydrate-binding family 9-like protein [Sedimentisphaeraceae bacterium JB056]
MKKYIEILILLVAGCLYAANVNSVKIHTDFELTDDISGYPWDLSSDVYTITDNWQGKPVSDDWHTSIKSVWTDENLYVLFVANYSSLAVNKSIVPDDNGNCWGIWSYDVVEMFIGDNPDIKKYYEFVTSPLGQKIDIRHNKNIVKGDSYFTNYTSNWEVKSHVVSDKWICQFKIPLKSISSDVIYSGKQFNCNFYRCTGDTKTNADIRHYMALKPTNTPTPSFHVPENFGTLTLVEAKEPEAVLNLDFEDIAGKDVVISEHTGVNSSKSLVMYGEDSKPLIITDKDTLEKLAGAKSLTVSGWVKRPVTFDDTDYQPPVIINCHGVFQVTFERWGRLGIMMTGADGRRKQLWGGWINIPNFTPDNRWLFFAFSYDGTKNGPNCALYYGYEEYPIECETFRAADAGQRQDDPDKMWSGEQRVEAAAGMLAESAPQSITVGAYNAAGVKQVNGQLDSIRIYASNVDDSAALDYSQIEKIRLDDIGDDTFRQVAIQKAAKQAQDKKRQWQIEQQYWLDNLNLHRVELFKRIFTDDAPMPMIDSEPVSVPRGGKAAMMFAAMSRQRGKIEAEIRVKAIRNADGAQVHFPVELYHVKNIPVEANNNGGINTTISSQPPQIWMEHIVKKAPFRTAEVLVPADKFLLRENNAHALMYQGILVDIDVPVDTPAGIYHGDFVIDAEGEQKRLTFSFRVHQTVKPAQPRLNNVYWFKADPANLTIGEKPKLWSDGHWKLIENSARTLHSYGQNTMSVSLISHRDETINFIKTIKNVDGSYDFDFSMFDKWIETFLRCGFNRFEGECAFGGHNASALNVRAYDKKSLSMVDIFTTASDFVQWLDFMEIFYQHLYSHLKDKGWDKYYVQGVIDEPTNIEKYKKAYALTKKVMPDIMTKDACGNTDYSDYIDIQVFNMSLFKESYQQVAKKRRKQGKGVWFYHCASPYPPYPNRHLDDPLSCSRLFPWLSFKINADGYLFWAANNYRTADPYKSSIGPLPGGITNPGHPPGDDWMYYPGAEGLLGSMRMLAFREGLTDYDLLSMLAEKDSETAGQILEQIIRTPVNYEKDPAAYRAARKQLLIKLDLLEN